MKTLPSEKELKDAFTDFAWFTFDLLSQIQKNKKYLKFAAVNSQIALELFLKYYFMRSKKSDEIKKKKNGIVQPEFNDFSQILNHFYASRNWSPCVKGEFVKLLETRNAIVHRGQKANWDKEIAKSIVRTLLFIHSTAWTDLGEIFFFNNHLPHPVSINKIWREGVESFVTDLVDIYNNEVLTCMACNAYSVVNGEIFVLDEAHAEDNLICLNCLTSVDISHEARLITCYQCAEKSYLVDVLNEQKDQLYLGKCSECDAADWVRRCANCEKFYHPSISKEVKATGKYFCCHECEKVYSEHHNYNKKRRA